MQPKENKSHQLASWLLIANWYFVWTNGMQPKENKSHQLASWLLLPNWYFCVFVWSTPWNKKL
jgi:hypothetical protein